MSSGNIFLVTLGELKLAIRASDPIALEEELEVYRFNHGLDGVDAKVITLLRWGDNVVDVTNKINYFYGLGELS